MTTKADDFNLTPPLPCSNVFCFWLDAQQDISYGRHCHTNLNPFVPFTRDNYRLPLCEVRLWRHRNAWTLYRAVDCSHLGGHLPVHLHPHDRARSGHPRSHPFLSRGTNGGGYLVRYRPLRRPRRDGCRVGYCGRGWQLRRGDVGPDLPVRSSQRASRLPHHCCDRAGSIVCNIPHSHSRLRHGLHAAQGRTSLHRKALSSFFLHEHHRRYTSRISTKRAR